MSPFQQVPQQKNDFDCGLFVLFFIQRFIEDAPQRLKLQDLGMVRLSLYYIHPSSLLNTSVVNTNSCLVFHLQIHKEWFKPSEASALRIKIWNKLIELFGESVIK